MVSFQTVDVVILGMVSDGDVFPYIMDAPEKYMLLYKYDYTDRGCMGMLAYPKTHDLPCARRYADAKTVFRDISEYVPSL